MNSPEDTLHERLLRMEAGEPVESCLQGTTQEVQEALEIAGQLRNLDWSGQSNQKATSQRWRLLSLIDSSPTLPVKEKKMNNLPESNKPFWRRHSLALVLASTAVLLLCGLVALGIGTGALAWLNSHNGQRQASKMPAMVKDPGEGALYDLHGLVEVFKGDVWSTADSSTRIEPGMHIRTGALSSASLALYDGSQIALGPGTELVVDELQARKGGGARVVVFTQLLGSSEHTVAKTRDDESRYEVRTGAATGTALGTVFKVQVKADQSASFTVSDGEVSVTGQDSTVVVQAGETTTTAPDQAPADPGFFVTGSGEVALTGETWIIGGVTLKTLASTVILGNPQVGDIAFFEGRLLPDNTRVADLIVLLRRSPANSFSLTGIVNEMSDTNWTVNQQEIAVLVSTVKDAGIVIGDLVQVEGLVLADGTLQAEKIIRLQGQPGLPFDFSGVVQQAGDPAWQVSGVTLKTDANTHIDAGLTVGSLVHVTGWVLADGTWLAKTIEARIDETRAFEFIGTIDQINPWVVAGIALETTDWTHIDEGLKVGERVQVKGQLTENGVWTAYEIRRLPAPSELRFILIGVVTSLNPWAVNGITLAVDGNTQIIGEITLGMLVRVEIQPLPDGTWKILKIEPVSGFTWGLGCQELTAKVIHVGDGEIELEGWPVLPLSQDVENAHTLTPNTIILFQVCFNPDGTAQVVYIVIIFQPTVIETEEPEEPEPPESEQPNDKVMICHKPDKKSAHTIVVARPAVPAHLGHGDKLGPCP